jgi:hypothetical protein
MGTLVLQGLSVSLVSLAALVSLAMMVMVIVMVTVTMLPQRALPGGYVGCREPRCSLLGEGGVCREAKVVVFILQAVPVPS